VARAASVPERRPAAPRACGAGRGPPANGGRARCRSAAPAPLAAALERARGRAGPAPQLPRIATHCRV